MKVIENFDINSVPIWRILFVATSEPDYSMDRVYLIEQDDDYLLITGGHCSCYGFDDTSWGAVVYNQSELLKVAKGWKESGWGSESIIADLIINYIS